MSKIIKKIILVACGVLIASGGFFAFYHFSYADKILAGVNVAGINVAGLTAAQAKEKLGSELDKFADQEIKFTSGGKTWIVKPAELGIDFNIELTAAQAIALGRDGAWYTNLWTATQTLWRNTTTKLNYDLDKDTWDQCLTEHFAELETQPLNASLSLIGSTVTEISSQDGIVVDRPALLNLIDHHLQQRLITAITLPFATAFPIINNDDIAPAKLAAVNLLGSGLTINYKEKTWNYSRDRIGSVITFVIKNDVGEVIPPEEVFSYGQNLDNPSARLEITLRGDDFKNFLENIAREVEREPQNAHFKIEGNPIINLDNHKDPESIVSVSVDEPAQEGLTINAKQLNRDISNNINNNQVAIDLFVETRPPEIDENNATEKGITKLIGRGVSSFSGSPSNRQHNIAIGADKFDRVVIPPGAEFSFNNILGKVTAEAGYLPELVIKNHDTVPDLGGGLCQVSTTAFRAAVDAGLPVTERKNHAYAVTYYSPQGTDATIYPGSSDLKFINDTPGPILIQTSISGRYLTFDFLGTHDGREVQKFKPHTYARFGNGGLKVEWAYKVMRQGETVTDEVFKSVYRPPEEFHKSKQEEKAKKAEEEAKKAEEEAKKAEEEAKKAEEEQKKKSPPSPSPTPSVIAKPSATPTPTSSPKP